MPLHAGPAVSSPLFIHDQFLLKYQCLATRSVYEMSYSSPLVVLLETMSGQGAGSGRSLNKLLGCGLLPSTGAAPLQMSPQKLQLKVTRLASFSLEHEFDLFQKSNSADLPDESFPSFHSGNVSTNQSSFHRRKV